MRATVPILRNPNSQNRQSNTTDDMATAPSTCACPSLPITAVATTPSNGVVAFDSDTPEDLIEAVRPDVFAKGGDYTRESLPEADLVERLGGAVQILPLVDDRSTTGIIRRARTAEPATVG